MTTATLTGSQRVLAALAVCLHPTAYSLAGDPEQLGDAHLRLALLDKPNRPTTKLLLGGLRQPASITIHNPHTTTNDPYLLARSSSAPNDPTGSGQGGRTASTWQPGTSPAGTWSTCSSCPPRTWRSRLDTPTAGSWSASSTGTVTASARSTA